MNEKTETRTRLRTNMGFVWDTTFVLFFLAVEYGRSIPTFSFEGAILTLTLLMVVVLPYFVASEAAKPDFGNWIVGRSFITILGLFLGLAFGQTIGVLLPDSFRFLPLTLLIVTSMISCYIQFYSLMKLRLAK